MLDSSSFVYYRNVSFISVYCALLVQSLTQRMEKAAIRQFSVVHVVHMNRCAICKLNEEKHWSSLFQLRESEEGRLEGLVGTNSGWQLGITPRTAPYFAHHGIVYVGFNLQMIPIPNHGICVVNMPTSQRVLKWGQSVFRNHGSKLHQSFCLATYFQKHAPIVRTSGSTIAPSSACFCIPSRIREIFYSSCYNAINYWLKWLTGILITCTCVSG